MPVSRLRLRLALGFAMAFAVGTGLLAAGGLTFMARESTRRFDAHLDGIGAGVISAVAREYGETPDSSYAFVAGEVAAEWPDNGDAFLLLDANGRLAARRDPDRAGERVLAVMPAGGASRFDIDRGGPDLRGRVIDTMLVVTVDAAANAREVRVVTFGSTEGIEADTELLSVAIAVGVPLILLASVLVGYLLAGRAMSPVRQLSQDIAAIAPADLSRRLLPQYGGDELGALAAEFDALMIRLEDAQQRNRQFVREAAHQIRTPLTLVLGEAELALHAVAGAPAAEPEAERLRSSLARVRTAAEQMRRRVDELFLLAEARAGEVVRLEERVELDSVVLECTDLMRARASVTGQALAIGDAEPVTVLGNGALLQEALLELIDNACRHGAPTAPIAVSCRVVQGKVSHTDEAILEVCSDGPPISEAAMRDANAHAHDRGLGLSIVRWVAISHHGRVELLHDAGRNVVRIVLPVFEG